MSGISLPGNCRARRLDLRLDITMQSRSLEETVEGRRGSSTRSRPGPLRFLHPQFVAYSPAAADVGARAWECQREQLGLPTLDRQRLDLLLRGDRCDLAPGRVDGGRLCRHCPMPKTEIPGLVLGPFDDIFTERQKIRVVRGGPRAHPPQRDRAAAAAHLPARRAPARNTLAAACAGEIDRSTVAASHPMTGGHGISERHWG